MVQLILQRGDVDFTAVGGSRMTADFDGRVADPCRLLDWCRTVTDDPELVHLDVVVAWAYRSGARLLSPLLRVHREHHGTSRAIVGVSRRGATADGLRSTIEAFDSSFVFHDPTRGIFHPKLYLCVGDEYASMWVGSANLSAAAMLSNYEVGMSLTGARDENPFAAARAYVDELASHGPHCRGLNEELIAELEANGLLGTEFDAPTGASALDDLFGGEDGQDTGAGKPIESWSKILPTADAQRLEGSNPSYCVTLVKGQSDVDIRIYFRHVLFADATWRNAPPAEVADIDFHVEIHGADMGTHRLQIAHNPAFESGQDNRSTLLRWKGLYSTVREQINVDGSLLTIERDSQDRYTLRIEAMKRN